MKLSYGQIYITLQCGAASRCSELNVISFKVNSRCAFTSRALISGVLELAKGSDVISESVLHSGELRQITLRHKSKPSQCARCVKPLLMPFLLLLPAASIQGLAKVPTEFKGGQPSLWLSRIFPLKHFHSVRTFLIQSDSVLQHRCQV